MTNDTVVIHKYKVIEKIGAGGFSTVYKAQHIITNKIVALKIVKLPEYAAVIRNESKIISYLNRDLTQMEQPFFPTLHWYGKFGKMTCLATTYYSKSLWEILQRELTLLQKMRIGTQMIYLIQCVHNLHIVHCDIKPDNFMINDNANLVLIDFGLARPYFDFKTNAHVPNIKTHGPIGTLEYMSDYVKEGNKPSRRDDVISICKIIKKIGIELPNICLEYEETPDYQDILNKIKNYTI